MEDELRDITDFDPHKEEKSAEDMERVKKMFRGRNIKHPMGMSFGMLAASHTGPIPMTLARSDCRNDPDADCLQHLVDDSPCKGCQVHMPVEKNQWLRSQHADLFQKKNVLGPQIELVLMNEICQEDLENKRRKATESIVDFCKKFSMVVANHMDCQEKHDGNPARFEWFMDAGPDGDFSPFIDGESLGSCAVDRCNSHLTCQTTVSQMENPLPNPFWW